ncbi:hypothetical protein TWF569_006912 [Orbilia oligospora]|nr:hypothetical protein TWF569_006912 [Orbilia oligospora]
MSGRQLSDISLQLSNLNLRSKRSTQRGPRRDRYVLFLGPDRTKFTIRAQNFNLYAPDFNEEISSWPQLSAHAAKITFDFCAARYLGYRSADDIETLRACSDVYSCADEWGIQSLKTHICQIISTSNVLKCIDDYATFLGQVYRLYVHFADEDKTLDDAVTKCLRTIAKEHSQYAGTKRRTLRNPIQHPMTREQEMHDILSTEFTWLERDCFCNFCKYQRRSYGRGKPGPFWNFKSAQADLEHDSKAIWASGLAPIKFLFKVPISLGCPSMRDSDSRLIAAGLRSCRTALHESSKAYTMVGLENCVPTYTKDRATTCTIRTGGILFSDLLSFMGDS